MTPKYIAGLVLSVPVMPLLWIEGKWILQSMPALAENPDREGSVGTGEQALKIFAVGESTIAGVGARNSRKGLVGQTARFLAERLSRNVRWNITAGSGLTIRHVIEVVRDTDVESADLVMVGVGGNDVFKLNHPYRFDHDLRELIALLTGHFPDTPIVFTHMPPIQDLPVWSGLMRFFMSGLTDILEENLGRIIADYPHVHYCDDRISLDRFKKKVDRPSATEEFFSDGVHPSELTYRLWGEEVADYICQHVLEPR